MTTPLDTAADTGTGRHLLPSILIAIIVVGAAALRFWDLDRTGLWYDEAVSWTQSRGSLAELIAQVASDNYPPLHNLVLWVSIRTIGDTEFALRLPSVLFGIATVWLLYRIGCRLSDRTTGLAVATLAALSPFLIWYSTEARMYALLAATGLAFLLAVLKALDSPALPRLAAAALFGALFLYTHVYALFGVAAVGTILAGQALRDWSAGRSLISTPALRTALALVTAGLMFLPWFIVLWNRASAVASEGFWIAYPDIPFLKTMIVSMAGSEGAVWILAAGVLALAIALALAAVRVKADRHEPRLGLAVVAAYVFGPAILAYAYSILVQPVLFDRYLIAAWPGFLLLAALGANRLWPRFGPWGLTLGVTVLCQPALQDALFEKQRPDWRAIADAYRDMAAPDDRLWLYKGFAAPALAYYLRADKAFHAIDDTAELSIIPASTLPGSDWLVIAHVNGPEYTAALGAAGAPDAQPQVRVFGWGAGGLTLLRLPRRDDSDIRPDATTRP